MNFGNSRRRIRSVGDGIERWEVLEGLRARGTRREGTGRETSARRKGRGGGRAEEEGAGRFGTDVSVGRDLDRRGEREGGGK